MKFKLFMLAVWCLAGVLLGHVGANLYVDWRDAKIAHRTSMSELAFSEGNYHLVLIPAGSFDFFFPGATIITDVDNLGPDVFYTPDGWIIKNTTIEKSPDMEINLKYVKTWTWTCEYTESNSWSEGDTWHQDEYHCGAGEQPWKKTRTAFTTRDEALAARDEHIEESGHRPVYLLENMILKPMKPEEYGEWLKEHRPEEYTEWLKEHPEHAE